MVTYLALKRGATAASLFNKLFTPIRSVSATPCIRRCFNTNASAYEEYNRSLDADRRSRSSVTRRLDNDLFSGDLFDPFSTMRSLNLIFNTMDAKEDENSLNLRFDMPGMDKQNVKISVEQNTLIIKADKESEEDDDDEPRRRYSSRFDLPTDTYKLEEIKAAMKNGMLKISVPKVKMEERKDVFQVQVE